MFQSVVPSSAAAQVELPPSEGAIPPETLRACSAGMAIPRWPAWMTCCASTSCDFYDFGALPHDPERLRDADDLEPITYDVLNLARQNVRYAEVTFSPARCSFHGLDPIGPDAIQRGYARARSEHAMNALL